jgi:hypothetical protein
METKYIIALGIYVIGVLFVYGILYFIALGNDTFDDYSFWNKEPTLSKVSFRQKVGIFLISLSSWLFFIGCLVIECVEKIKAYFASSN